MFLRLFDFHFFEKTEKEYEVGGIISLKSRMVHFVSKSKACDPAEGEQVAFLECQHRLPINTHKTINSSDTGKRLFYKQLLAITRKAPMTDESRCRDPQPNIKQRSRSPVREREKMDSMSKYMRIMMGKPAEMTKPNLVGTHESWNNDCGPYMYLD
ncbi:hypothetical protein STEG23_038227 [Scotinomys teguina]